MTSSNPLPDNDLSNGYGYQDFRLNDLDHLAGKWSAKTGQRWSRLKEVKVDLRGINKTPAYKEKHVPLTQKEADFFSRGVRAGFVGIALKHELSPTQMWGLVESGMRKLGIHADDLDDLQSFCFGWTELTPAAMCRWALRCSLRCPLLDVLCSLDQNCDELNQVQEWLLDKNGAYGRVCNDALPALPNPDGARPAKEKDFDFVKYYVELTH